MANFHGSDIEKIAAEFQIQPETILNFGVNANPLGLSSKVKAALAENVGLIERYPDPTYTELKASISRYLNVEFARILPANGTSELISQLIRHFRPRSALLYTPTYSEYGREIRRQGGNILSLPLLEQDNFLFPHTAYKNLLEQADFILLCNPNNPTATLLSVDELKNLLLPARSRGIPFIIDETYIEFTPDPHKYSAASLLAEFDNLIILRGFSKFFAAPGLRLGYGLFGNPLLLHKLQDNYPWNVHALAAFAGPLFFDDNDYITASRQYLISERERVLRFLEGFPDIIIYPSVINFFLLQMKQKNATELFLTLLRQGLMIRNFHDEIGTGFFRFCLLNKNENDRLLHAIGDFLQQP